MSNAEEDAKPRIAVTSLWFSRQFCTCTPGQCTLFSHFSLSRHSKHSSFLCRTPKANTPSPAQLLLGAHASCNPWPKITLENDTHRARGGD